MLAEAFAKIQNLRVFRFPVLSDQELAVLLERSRPEFEQPKLEFPKLSKSQQQFGVNPAYQPPPPADPAEKTSANGKPCTCID